MVLVAGLGAAGAPSAAAPPAAAATPAPAGSVTLGTQSRMIVEQADEFVEVFVLADLVNSTERPGLAAVADRLHAAGRGARHRGARRVHGRGAREQPHRGEGAAAVRADARSSSATGCPATAAA